MIFKETRLKGSFIIEPERFEDERGFFARTWCKNEFEINGLDTNLVQCNISFNKKSGTLRGMHFQKAPYSEIKLVRCTRGAVYDVIIDLRRDSDTFREWLAVELTEENRMMLYVPEGIAHGFLTLKDNTELFYQMSEFYYPDYAGGVRWNDPAFSVNWPADVRIISERDRDYPDFQG
ncbi:MAG: dTDP-4-dehydrorhamnose 3,5-epimerase [Nitrospirota bacterium]